ncbi:MAG: hypothetical protein CR982_06995 [Candidatus Cloacimonadota bacterium]|nr:MAG: hypothetical protein CR982_06995 [Candidatus Cloacimonadota bacterium]PIE80655.1 MAG: hypothetical protein CSA15_01770 [Candidatus Delongbacteria bacterium]
MNEIHPFKQVIIILSLVTFMCISMGSLLVLVSEELIALDKSFLIFSYLISTAIVLKIFYYLIKSKQDFIKSYDFILELEIDKKVWLENRKKDYLKTFFVKIAILISFLLPFSFLFIIIYKEDPVVFFVLLNLFLSFLLPLFIILGKYIKDELVNNIFSEKYIIKFYREVIFVNRWIFPLSFSDWRNKIKIKKIKTGKNFIEFITLHKGFIPSLETTSKDFVKIRKLRIPISDTKKIELLKKRYNIRSK